MSLLAQPTADRFRFTDFSVGLALSDLKEKDALHRLRGGKGASISWSLGHLLQYRARLLGLLGRECDASDLDCFQVEADDGALYPALDALRPRWGELAGQLESAFAESSDDQLLAPMAGPDGSHGEQKLLDTINFFAYHEAYHMGQVGLIRVELGYPAISELVMGGST